LADLLGILRDIYHYFGKKAVVLSRVGSDIIGKRIIDNLSQCGVDVSYIQSDDANGTTLVFVQRTELKSRLFC